MLDEETENVATETDTKAATETATKVAKRTYKKRKSTKKRTTKKTTSTSALGSVESNISVINETKADSIIYSVGDLVRHIPSGEELRVIYYNVEDSEIGLLHDRYFKIPAADVELIERADFEQALDTFFWASKSHILAVKTLITNNNCKSVDKLRMIFRTPTFTVVNNLQRPLNQTPQQNRPPS